MAVLTQPNREAIGGGDGAARDADLALRVRTDSDGGQAAFRVLYDRYHDELFAFLRKLLNDSALSEDVLQEAFLKAYAAIDQYDPERAFRPWIYRIARNAALDALRVRKKVKRLEALPRPRATDAGAAERLARKEDVARLQSALDSLPPETKALLIQRHGLCMKLSELSQSFDCTERTIRNRLRAAAGLLAQALSTIGGAE